MVYEKTPLGVEAFHQKPSQLSGSLRSILIMIDGKRPLVETLNVLAAIGAGQGQLDQLAQMGLIRVSEASARVVAKAQEAVSAGVGLVASADANVPMNEQLLYQKAYPIATRLTSGLGLRGFRLNLAVEGAGSIKDLVALADKIKDAVGEDKYKELKPFLNRS